jgi:hypothetical protein
MDGASVLDPVQLARIEGTHRGFLYQHLYAVACLLQTDRTWTRLYSERDEDVELSSEASHVYVQVKSRQDGELHPSDVESTLARFAALHLEHTAGQRSARPVFVIVTNAEPSARLLEQADDYSFDISIVTPARPPSPDLSIPEAPPDIQSSVRACTAAAAQVPFCKVAPATLTWKLAGLMGLVSSGSNPGVPHALEAEALPHVFEQFTRSAQTWPSVPERFHQSDDDPPIVVDERLRVIRGASGAGKSSWAGFAMLHTPRSATYFDARNARDDLAADIAREVTASAFRSRGDVASEVLAVGRSGAAALAVLDQYVADRTVGAEVFLDNAHLVDQEQLLASVEATKHLRWTLLTRPSETTQILCQRLGIDGSDLAPWSIAAIADEANALDVVAAPATIERVLGLTGGNPLFVRSTLRLARRLHGGSVEALVDALSTGNHIERTRQEEVCDQLVGALQSSELGAALALAHAGIELRQDEAVSMMLAATGPGASRRRAAQALRRVVAEGVVTASEGGVVRLHDSFHLHLLERLEDLEPGAVGQLDRGLEEVLRARVLKRDLPVPHLVRFVEVLHRVGKLDEVTELLSGIVEYLEEHGVTDLVAGVLHAIEGEDSEPPAVRFWAADTFAFLVSQHRDLDVLERTTERMRTYLEEMGNPAHEFAAWSNKRVCLAGQLRDLDRLRHEYKDARTQLDASPGFDTSWRRALEYNYANFAAQLGDHAAAAAILRPQVREYLDALGLKTVDVGVTKPADLVDLMGKNWTFDDAKRLGDVLEVLAICEEGLGFEPAFERMHAAKFFQVAGAIRSCLRAGLTEVHRLLHAKHDAGSAWELLKLVAPAAAFAGSFEFTFDVMVEEVRVSNYMGAAGKRAAEERYQHLRPLLRAARATRLEEELEQLLSLPPVVRVRSRLDPRMPSEYSRLAMEAVSAQKFGTPFTGGQSFFEAVKHRLGADVPKTSTIAQREKPRKNNARKRERAARRRQRKGK